MRPSAFDPSKLKRRVQPQAGPDSTRNKKIDKAAEQVERFLQSRGQPAVDLGNQAWLKDTYAVVMRNHGIDMTARNMLTLHRRVAELVGVKLSETYEWTGGQRDTLLDPEAEAPAPKSDDTFAYDNEGSTAGAGYLPRQNLFHLARHAQSVHDSLTDGDPIEDWVEDKIAKALADIEDVADYVVYRKSRGVDENAYRRTDYSDIPAPETPDWQRLHREYFEDARSGLGMGIQQARLYAEEAVEEERAKYRKELELYNLKTKPSDWRGSRFRR